MIPTGLLLLSCADDSGDCSAHHTNDRTPASAFDVSEGGGVHAARHKPSGRTYLGNRELPVGGPNVFALADAIRAFQRTSPDFQHPQGDYGEFSTWQLLSMAAFVCTHDKSLGCGDFTVNVSSAAAVEAGALGATSTSPELSSTMLGVGAAAGAQLRASRAAARSSCRPSSFTGETPVLMADGSTKRIDEVKAGDQVFAVDPETGESGPRKVIETFIREGLKHLVEIEIDGDKIIATDEHPFWLPDQKRWVPARDLRVGSVLQTATGTQLKVNAIKKRIAITRVHNMDVYGIDTYHVLAGVTPVLVHNSSCARFEVDPNGVINDLQGPQAQILINKAAGDGFRNDLAAFLRGQGRTVVTDGENKAALTFSTPHGSRTFDLGVWDRSGNLLGYVEAKKGGSPYNGAQQLKDAWLRETYGFNIAVVRGVG